MQFLIDECLTVRLVDAIGRGWHAAHVAHIGRSGMKDWELMPLILDGDWTFVTRNAVDFRGQESSHVQAGLYHGVALHGGLVCLVGEPLRGTEQVELFEAVLEKIGNGEPINKRIEARLLGDEISIDFYDMP